MDLWAEAAPCLKDMLFLPGCTSAGPETQERDGSRSPAVPRRPRVRPRARWPTGNWGYAPLASASGLAGSGDQHHRRARALALVWFPAVQTSLATVAAALAPGFPLDGYYARSRSSGACPRGWCPD